MASIDIAHYVLMRLSPVLSLRDLPSPELQAARLDGELFAIDQCFSPVDEIDNQALRAGALGARLHPRLIAEQRSAAWVLGALLLPPGRHQLCADISARVRPADTTGLIVREVVVDDEDLLNYPNFRITTPLRTVVDLARFSVTFGSEEVRMVHHLMAIGGHVLADCHTMLNRRRNLPGKRRALTRIEAAIGQPPVTLYTS